MQIISESCGKIKFAIDSLSGWKMVQGGAWKGLYLVCYYSILVISTQCSLDDKIEYMVIKFGQ